MTFSEYVREQLAEEYKEFDTETLDTIAQDELANIIAETLNLDFSDVDILFQEYLESYRDYCSENGLTETVDIDY